MNHYYNNIILCIFMIMTAWFVLTLPVKYVININLIIINAFIEDIQLLCPLLRGCVSSSRRSKTTTIRNHFMQRPEEYNQAGGHLSEYVPHQSRRPQCSKSMGRTTLDNTTTYILCIQCSLGDNYEKLNYYLYIMLDCRFNSLPRLRKTLSKRVHISYCGAMS